MMNVSEVKNACFGCRSCEQICPADAIVMRYDQEGFLYPVVDRQKCIECSSCVNHCPAQIKRTLLTKPLSAFAFRSKHDERIIHSASGGASDLLAQHIIDGGGIVYGAAYDKKQVVKHVRIDSCDGLPAIRSSKYVQSDTDQTYSLVKNDLENGKMVLYTGVPCQIDGLYAFLGKEYSQLFTLDLICHGVPSPVFFQKYLEYQKKHLGGEIVRFDFRTKEKNGWNSSHCLRIETGKKVKFKGLFWDRYGNHFLHYDCLRESCYQCPYASIHRVGDLTLGDFWGIRRSYPELFSDKGVSCVLVNTEKGQNLLERVRPEAWIEEVTTDSVVMSQKRLVLPPVRPTSRDGFYRNLNRPGFIKGVRVHAPMKRRIRAALPTFAVRFYDSLKKKIRKA